ncbi:hypothetical protein V6N13_013855 [Hibiscus sabdariffa]
MEDQDLLFPNKLLEQLVPTSLLCVSSECSGSKDLLPTCSIVCSASYLFFFQLKKWRFSFPLLDLLLAKLLSTLSILLHDNLVTYSSPGQFLNLRNLKDARERLQQSVDSANRRGEVIFDDVQRWLIEVNEKISDQAATQLQEDEEKVTKRFIKVKNCNTLQNLFSSSIVKRLSQLEELEVSKCENIIGLIVEKEEIDENGILEFNKLRILKLNQLNRFIGLWYSKNTLQSSACLFDIKISCPILEKLELNGCHKLKYVFTSSMVKSFVHLKELKIYHCDEMEWVIEGTLAAEKEGSSSSIRVFPKLESLELLWLSKLRKFCCEFNPIEFPSLKSLKIWRCSTFSFGDGKSIVTPTHYLLDEMISCHALEKLEVGHCHKLKYLFTSSMVKSFEHLKTLKISSCDEMEEAIEGTFAAEGISNVIRVFPKLDSLELEWLSKLRNFCCVINSIEFPSLKSLMIWECPALNTFTFDDGKNRITPPHFLFDEKISCPALERLEVKKCHKLKYLFTSSMVRSFVHMETLSVFCCDELEGVMEGILAATEEERISGSIRVFPKLDYLLFENLSKLNRFYCGINSTEFPSLRSLTIQNCPDLSSNAFDDGKNKVASPHSLLNEKISCPALKELEVKECHKLKYVFTSSIVKSFVHLETFRVSYCDEMEGVIEGTLPAEEGIRSNTRLFPNLDSLKFFKLSKLKKFCCGINPIEFPLLRNLEIQFCPALNKFTFDDGKSKITPSHYLFNEKVILPVLEKLEIRGVDNLERLWADQLVEHSFSKLTSIELRECPKLLNVFPLSMLPRLQRLESLYMWRCESVEEIISEGGGSCSNSSSGGMPSLSPQFIQSFEVPNLTSKTLEHLPNLKSIHHKKMHTINWPSLKEMTVRECHRVEILFAKYGETSSEQPLFWVNESTFPNLQQLTLGCHCNSQLLSPYFPNLKLVRLDEYPKQVTGLPSYLLSLPNLQTLGISRSSFKEMIFQSEEGGEEKPASLLLSHITQLSLHFLRELMHLWKEKEGFPNLRILHVSGCPKLKANLVPSSVSFRNLVTLEHATIDEHEDSKEVQSNPLTATESEECENSKEDQSNPSSSMNSKGDTQISGLATYFQGYMKFDAERSVSFSCSLGVMNTTTAELQAIKMGMEVQNGRLKFA